MFGDRVIHSLWLRKVSGVLRNHEESDYTLPRQRQRKREEERETHISAVVVNENK